ncbi:hypothetical protein BASA81_007413 [Batrachochytrium salamandrivorans]|nr:hypothetical protein BASA81_007413 [Batrachochytrium salamandrivorans]
MPGFGTAMQQVQQAWTSLGGVPHVAKDYGFNAAGVPFQNKHKFYSQAQVDLINAKLDKLDPKRTFSAGSSLWDFLPNNWYRRCLRGQITGQPVCVLVVRVPPALVRWLLTMIRIEDFHDEDDVEMLVSALTHENNRIETLHLNRSHVNDKGAKALAEAIQHPRNKLHTLFLSGNPIGVDSSKALAVAITHPNCQLAKLDVDAAWGKLVSNALTDNLVNRNLIVLLSARQIKRIGSKSALRQLPTDLIRLLMQMVRTKD